jgi:hypothetical protein
MTLLMLLLLMAPLQDVMTRRTKHPMSKPDDERQTTGQDG